LLKEKVESVLASEDNSKMEKPVFVNQNNEEKKSVLISKVSDNSDLFPEIKTATYDGNANKINFDEEQFKIKEFTVEFTKKYFIMSLA